MASKNLPIIDWLEIQSSAPGKFIISGEYSVVYEKQAIAAAIDLRTRVTIRPNKDGKVRLILKNLNHVREWPTTSLPTDRLVTKFNECLDYNDSMPNKLNHLLHARFHVAKELNEDNNGEPSTSQQEDAANVGGSGVGGEQGVKTTTTTTTAVTSNDNKDIKKKADDATLAFLMLYIGLGDSYQNSAKPPIDVEVESSVPVGSGLGSSSAYSVAICGALMKVFLASAERWVISNWAFNVDKFFHGRPSGVDNNIITHGGYILFQNGKIKTLEAVHKHPAKVLLIDTGVSRSTRELSENVIAQLREQPSRINGLFNSMNELTTQIWRRINHPDFTPKSIGDYLQANQECLDALGVGHEKLTDIFTKAQGYDLKAKQTGAGGGGTAFILFDDTENNSELKQLKKDLIESGYNVHEHTIGCEGLSVRIVPNPDKRFPNI